MQKINIDEDKLSKYNIKIIKRFDFSNVVNLKLSLSEKIEVDINIQKLLLNKGYYISTNIYNEKEEKKHCSEKEITDSIIAFIIDFLTNELMKDCKELF